MDKKTEKKYIDLSGMEKAITDILKQAWERGRKYGECNPKPPPRPMLILENGKYIYLTQEHIDCLLEFEKQKMVKEVCENFMRSLGEMKDDFISSHDTFESENKEE